MIILKYTILSNFSIFYVFEHLIALSVEIILEDLEHRLISFECMFLFYL